MAGTTSTLAANLDHLLRSGKLIEAENLVRSNEREIEKDSWNVVTVAVVVLKENLEKDEVVDCCNAILLHIAKVGNAKEVLIWIMEEIANGVDDTVFTFFLEPVKMTLRRLPGKRGTTFRFTLDTLTEYLAKMPVPKSRSYEGEERMFLDLDPDVRKVTEVTRRYLDVYRPFVEESSLLSSAKKRDFPERISYERDIICHHLLQILDRPLAYLDLTHEEGKAESSTRVCAMKVMTYLRQMKGNSLELYDFSNDSLKKDEDSDETLDPLGEKEVSGLAVSTLAYLIVKERLGNLPAIYTPVYLFEKHLKYVVVLLSNGEDLVRYKGLHLFESILSILEPSVFPKELADIPHILNLHRCLVDIMIYSRLDEYRTQALRSFKSYVTKYNAEGKCRIIVNLLSSEGHSGFRALLVQTYKDNLHEAMQLQDTFLGQNLKKVIELATKLPENAETDLLDDSDCTLVTLNFLRYLAIRDRPDVNRTGVWDYMDRLKNEYLKDLRTGLNLSRAHYKMKSLEMDRDAKNCKRDISKKIQYEQGSRVMQSALVMFDVLESVVARLEEYL